MPLFAVISLRFIPAFADDENKSRNGAQRNDGHHFINVIVGQVLN